MREFEDHVAVVTGGASGIGAACAAAFAASGARVAILDIISAEIDEGILPFAVDVRDEGAVTSAIAEIVRRWGRIDHLVNSAVNFVAEGPAATTEHWRAALDVNVIGSARLTSMVAQHMRPGSTVVNISSISAHSAQPHRWTYNASKAAILALTRGQALDFSDAGIRVNTVSPGWIWTPEVAKAAGGDRDKWEPMWGKYHILRRLGEANEVADAVIFLSGPRSSFITGSELFVDGGYHALGPEGLGDTSKFAGTSD
jgi:NAD(P)-dependent dehydrogenase (short-subunit alcohol dehydrogenase family)